MMPSRWGRRSNIAAQPSAVIVSRVGVVRPGTVLATTSAFLRTEEWLPNLVARFGRCTIQRLSSEAQRRSHLRGHKRSPLEIRGGHACEQNTGRRRRARQPIRQEEERSSGRGRGQAVTEGDCHTTLHSQRRSQRQDPKRARHKHSKTPARKQNWVSAQRRREAHSTSTSRNREQRTPG